MRLQANVLSTRTAALLMISIKITVVVSHCSTFIVAPASTVQTLVVDLILCSQAQYGTLVNLLLTNCS